jgi:hypothetical protein
MSAAELIMATGSEPPTPASGRVTLYVGADDTLYIKDAAGSVQQVSSVTTPPTVSGSRGGNAALASLLTALEGLGLIVDATTT